MLNMSNGIKHKLNPYNSKINYQHYTLFHNAKGSINVIFSFNQLSYYVHSVQSYILEHDQLNGKHQVTLL